MQGGFAGARHCLMPARLECASSYWELIFNQHSPRLTASHMSQSQFRIPSHFAPRIRSLLETAYSSESSDTSTAQNLWLLPSTQQIGLLLDVPFFASQYMDEGRQTALSVEFTDVPKNLSDRRDSYEFDKPISFNPRELAKLAPAVEAATTHLGVRPVGQDELEVWGVIHYGNKQINTNTTRVASGVLAETSGIGAVKLQLKGRPLLRFNKGDALLFEGSSPVLASTHFLQIVRRFIGCFGSTEKAINHKSRMLYDIASAITDLHHGGAVLLQERKNISRGITIKFKSKGLICNRLSDALGLHAEHALPLPNEAMFEFPLIGDDPRHANSYYQLLNSEWAQTRYQKAVAFVARLSAVDGAVLVDEHLNIAGFGAFIDFDPGLDSETKIMQRNADVSRWTEIELSKVGGARHQSAVRFCKGQSGPALAIIVSQDGTTSIVGKSNAEGIIQVVRF